jgi:hypothetical protein
MAVPIRYRVPVRYSVPGWDLFKTLLISYLCRLAVMDPVDEYDVLAAAICDEPADPDQHQQILFPPPSPLRQKKR